MQARVRFTSRSSREYPLPSQSGAEYLALQTHDAKLFAKLNALIEECRRHPFKGTGKPEPLGGNLSGWWSRRISQEHRLVYEGGRQRRRAGTGCGAVSVSLLIAPQRTVISRY
ncbi:Txe/YoeB family addiction module toxin [Sphingomonas sp. KR1UV-12]|uniref:Putative mRNA interferase YoeB n=1 Tax=Sphingomonas aurea TaxID=3063994 RepID=A0ABT9ELM2_9SPHN|nr:Txe/YoeB family addiction module toxin [Sphingomonas sp. KR1UV-12]MDP1027688.1 Txe/YoeB family addiction module toxin [Sphingomonas sp. KR1UV-12]